MNERIVEFVEVSRRDTEGNWQPWCCVLVDEWMHGAFFVRLRLVLSLEPYRWQYCMKRYSTQTER